jgi:hypothetical protein
MKIISNYRLKPVFDKNKLFKLVGRMKNAPYKIKRLRFS